MGLPRPGARAASEGRRAATFIASALEAERTAVDRDQCNAHELAANWRELADRFTDLAVQAATAAAHYAHIRLEKK